MAVQIYVNGQVIDTSADVDIALNLSIADISAPETRSTSFTKSIIIEGTKANNKLFGFIFNVNSSILNTSSTVNFLPDFNPNLKAPCSIYENNILQAKGFMQLLQVNVYGTDLIEYEVTIYGELGNLFGTIGSGKLIDLDLSQYNHVWNSINVTDSWNTSIKDTAGISGVTAFAYGTGYVYPFVDYGLTNTPRVMLTEYFRPAVYAKTIVDKIFAAAGYSYTSSSFFGTAFFKRLIIPFTGAGFNLTSTEISDRTFEVSTATTVTTTIGDIVLFDTEAADTYNQYNPATGEFTFTQPGTYSFNIALTCTNATTPGLAIGYVYWFLKNGVNIFNFECIDGATVPVNSFNLSGVVVAVGDIFTFKLFSVFTTSGRYTTTYAANTAAVIGVMPDPTMAIGSTVDMNDILPSTVLQRDFLTSLTRLFNLYWDSTENKNEMIVQTRQTFLTNNVLDWTYKLDISQAVNIIPMGALDANPYYFKYKEDTDFYNDIYQKEFNRTYGDLKYFISNDFIKEEKPIEVIFSPTVMANEPAWGTDMVLPSIKTYDSSGAIQTKVANIRLLYYTKDMPTNGFTLDGNPLPYYNYPFAGHMDDPYNLTLDLSFDVPQKLYYGSVGGTVMNYPSNVNLFYNYYRTFINDITNKDSKIVRAYFHLTAQDISQVDFSYLYFFMGQYFRLNKVIDHKVGLNGVTQCEFIKAPLAETGDVNVGIGVMAIGTTFIIG